MSNQVADPAGGEDGGLTPELDPAISPGGHIPLSSGADLTAPGLLTASEPAAPAALSPSPAGTSARPARRGRAGRVIALVVLIVVAVAGIGAGGTLLTRELKRGPTNSERTAAVQQEIASRWQRYPAGKIFTPTLAYSSADSQTEFKATLVGIAAPASCAGAVDPVVAKLLVKDGCVTVLRATYLDYSGTQAVTIGVVVMKSAAAADRAASNNYDLPASAGLQTFTLSGTLADQFGDAQRRYFSAITSVGSYLLMSAAGYTDGRVSGSSNSTPSLADLGFGTLVTLQNVFAYSGSACALKDVRC